MTLGLLFAILTGLSWVVVGAVVGLAEKHGCGTALPNVFHPDFAAHCEKIAAGRCAANSPIAPGETWCPASPLSARLYRKPAEGDPR